MNSSNVVRRLLAHHLDCAPQAIHPWQSLEHDLDLTPLELVLVAMEIEEIEDVQLAVEGLASVVTVRELCTYLRRAVGRARRGPQQLASIA